LFKQEKEVKALLNQVETNSLVMKEKQLRNIFNTKDKANLTSRFFSFFRDRDQFHKTLMEKIINLPEFRNQISNNL
jgi:hypothetical protein